MAGCDQALFQREGDRPVEFDLIHALDGLCEQQGRTGFQHVANLPQENSLIPHFVKHRERQCEVKSAVVSTQAEGIRCGNVRLDTRSASSIFGCTSTQTTLPSGPTISAIGRLKNPMALPTSSTVIFGRTYGRRIL
jgi:hypothetical protein